MVVVMGVGVVVIVRRHGSELGGGIGREAGHWRLRIRRRSADFVRSLARLVRRCSLTSGFLLADSRVEALRLFRRSGPNPNGLVAGLPAAVISAQE
jgi:hypothetical protein